MHKRKPQETSLSHWGQKLSFQTLPKKLTRFTVWENAPKMAIYERNELLNFSQFFFSFSEIRILTLELIQPNPRFEVRLKNLKNDPEKPEKIAILSRNMGQKWAYYWKILTLSDTAKRTMKSIEKVKCRLLQLFLSKIESAEEVLQRSFKREVQSRAICERSWSCRVET